MYIEKGDIVRIRPACTAHHVFGAVDSNFDISTLMVVTKIRVRIGRSGNMVECLAGERLMTFFEDDLHIVIRKSEKIK
jgi:hypothetical protein